MAFPTGWDRRCAVTIQSSKVSGGSHTDFPVLLTLATLPSEMFDADGSHPARSDGGDIRFTSDRAGTTQLAREVVDFGIDNDPANGLAEIWVKIPTLSGSVDTTIYVWYDAPTETEPASDSTYGSEAVWSDFTSVYHLGDGTTVDLNDSAAAGHTLTNNDSVPAVSGQIEGGTSHTASVEWLSVADTADFKPSTGSFTFSAWVNRDDTSNEGRVGNKRGRGSGYAGWQLKGQQNGAGNWRFVDTIVSDGSNTAGWDSVFAGSTDYNTGQWYLAHMTWDGSAKTVTLYIDGAQDATNTNSSVGDIDNTVDFEIGGSDFLNFTSGNPGNGWPGDIDEVRWVKGTVRGSDWMVTEYNNQSAPSTFAIEGTPENPTISATIYAVEAGVTYTPKTAAIYAVEAGVTYDPKTAAIYAAEADVTYSPKTAAIYAVEAGLTYDPKTAAIYAVDSDITYLEGPTAAIYAVEATVTYDPKTVVIYAVEGDITYSLKNATIYAVEANVTYDPKTAAIYAVEGDITYDPKTAVIYAAEANVTYDPKTVVIHAVEGDITYFLYQAKIHAVDAEITYTENEAIDDNPVLRPSRRRILVQGIRKGQYLKDRSGG